jgi:hypothetical protein
VVRSGSARLFFSSRDESEPLAGVELPTRLACGWQTSPWQNSSIATLQRFTNRRGVMLFVMWRSYGECGNMWPQHCGAGFLPTITFLYDRMRYSASALLIFEEWVVPHSWRTEARPSRSLMLLVTPIMLISDASPNGTNIPFNAARTRPLSNSSEW